MNHQSGSRGPLGRQRKNPRGCHRHIALEGRVQGTLREWAASNCAARGKGSFQLRCRRRGQLLVALQEARAASNCTAREGPQGLHSAPATFDSTPVTRAGVHLVTHYAQPHKAGIRANRHKTRVRVAPHKVRYLTAGCNHLPMRNGVQQFPPFFRVSLGSQLWMAPDSCR